MNIEQKILVDNGKIIIWNTQAVVNETMEMIGEKIAEMAGESQSMTAMLIFEELFVNVANYAYPNTNNKPITIECTKTETSPLQIIFYDYGLPFDPTEYDCGEMRVEQVGGHGIRLVKELTSEFKYYRQNNQNIVKVVLLT